MPWRGWPWHSLLSAYRVLDVSAALSVTLLAVLAWLGLRARRAVWSPGLALLAAALGGALHVIGSGPAVLSAFAPDLALVLAVAGALLCLPAVVCAGRWGRNASAGRR